MLRPGILIVPGGLDKSCVNSHVSYEKTARVISGFRAVFHPKIYFVES